MALFLDCAVVVIIIVTCIVGYVKGFVKYLVGMVSTAVAAGVALWGSNMLAEPVYVRYFEKDVNTRIEKAMADVDVAGSVRQLLSEQGLPILPETGDIKRAAEKEGDLSRNLSDLVAESGGDIEMVTAVRERLDNYFGSGLKEDINEELKNAGLDKYVGSVNFNAEELKSCFKKALTGSRSEAAEYIAEKTVKRVLIGVIRTGLFAVCFIGAALVLKLIVFISGVFDLIPELKAADRFGGLALGAAKGLLYCALGAFILSTMVSATKDSLTVFNSGVSSRTYLFRYFFDFFYR